MSYTSGMAIGMAIGQQLFNVFGNKENKKEKNLFSSINFNKLPLDYVTETVEYSAVKLSSKIKGRRRYYIEVLKNNLKLKELLFKYLTKIKYINNIDINVNTGSLLITYNVEESTIDDLVDTLKEKIFTVKRTVKKMANKTFTSIEILLAQMVRDINLFIKKSTNNFLDLNTAFAFLFIIRGIRRILNLGERPTGPMMLWWGYSLIEGILSHLNR